MEDREGLLRRAREAYAARDWPRARELLAEAGRGLPLDADELVLLGDAAWWLGAVDESIASYERAYREFTRQDRPSEAAMAGLGAAVNLFLRGDAELAAGWVGRVARLLEGREEGPEHGYLCYLVEVEGGLDEGDPDVVVQGARRVGAIGLRHGDSTLVAAGLMGEGRALVKQGRVEEGLALLDQVMVDVVSGELQPDWAGNLYCHMMSASHELADVRRLAHWLAATTSWLASFPVAAVFMGNCRVHRSQVLLLQGQWNRSETEAERVARELADVHVAAVAESHYQVAEVRRLRGDIAGAEAAYRRAHERGRDPQPGLALLRLAEGRVRTAAQSIAAALAGQPFDRPARFRLRAAQAEIAVALGDLALAREAAAEVTTIAGDFRTSGFEAASRRVEGQVLLAEGRAGDALVRLRDALRRWRELDAPHEAARIRCLLAAAYAALGDEEARALELDAAAGTFERLGAEPDLREVTRLRAGPSRGRLSARETEVLRIVSAGRSNREVADRLRISEKTVARHLSSIFTKLDVASRTEAAAAAHELGLRPDHR